MDKDKLLYNVKVIEKHLEKNEKWFQQPEKKMKSFEKNAGAWNKEFLEEISNIEKVMKKLENYFES
ncbi:hypothetical protein D8M04_09420 [Oceanobacillus piezotolerans]|uniref:Uncharacterized protein n=1 Tax=Oceanobacillus piezotolerans TaxID=2448030 RepID=A0A498D5T9_9BACI|nr:hypothetical protein [Oceanobacillus piezotolerans]RLL45078.1 hypothetical protein D8M04_09420 [Oceanobacillus piezotolerans]